MAKQTFTTGQVLTAAQMTDLQATAMGGGAPVTKTTSYVLIAADAGTVIQMNSSSSTTITVNTALFAAGDSVQIQNIGSGTCTITAGTASVNTAGSLALTQWEGGFLYFTSTSTAIFFDIVQASGSSPLTTKGDLYGYNTTNARIPIGTDGQILTADSTAALGLKWAAAAGGTTFPTFSAKRGSTQTISASTWTKIQFNTESWDTGSAYDSTTNYRFTPQIAGYYQVNFAIWTAVNLPTQCFVAVYKNGAEWRFTNGGNGSCQVSLNGSTDYIEIYANVSAGSTGIQVESYFDAVGIRS